MNKTGIPWCDWSSNPVKGYCPGTCPYCYAHALYDKRGWNKEIRFDQKEIATWARAKPGDKIFVGSMIDLLHPSVNRPWVEETISWAGAYRDRTFIFLSKQYDTLASFNPWPANCWVGATVVDAGSFFEACVGLAKVQSKVKFLSIEPLVGMIIGSQMDMMLLKAAHINWLIIGAMTGDKKKLEVLSKVYPQLRLEPFRRKWSLQPPRAWGQDIISLANRTGIPLFIKDNLKWTEERREWP